MSYWNNKGKYQIAHDFLFKKLVPPSGVALNPLGEALRIVSRVYYRLNNNGDSYQGTDMDLSQKAYPFDKEYNALGRELDSLLNNDSYDDALSLVLVQIMLSLSSTSNVYNPTSNRLVPINSAAGKNALKALDLNSVFINYCGKNEEWLPETLRKEGVKIAKVLSEETRKELKCDTIQEFYTEKKQRYSTKKTQVTVTLSKDNTILSKKFSQIKSDHKKSVKEADKKRKIQQKRREQYDRKNVRRNVKQSKQSKQFHQQLKDLTVGKRIDHLRNLVKSKAGNDIMVKMILTCLIDYKVKKPVNASHKKRKDEVVASLTKGLNEAGEDVLKSLSNDGKDTEYSIMLSSSVDKKLDDLLVEVLGSSDEVDKLYNRCN